MNHEEMRFSFSSHPWVQPEKPMNISITAMPPVDFRVRQTSSGITQLVVRFANGKETVLATDQA